MRPIGFSTGALAYADFRKALDLLNGTAIDVVELSALREGELGPLISAIDGLDLSQFKYISIHAPSRFHVENEREIVSSLLPLAGRGWPVVVHPDAIHEPGLWRSLGEMLCIENMDTRKPVGRSAEELSAVFELFPEASFCCDIGHARQFDSTMTEAYLLLTQFQKRLVQVHVSEVNTNGRHDALSYTSIHAFREVAHLIPVEVPMILETPIRPGELLAEMDRVREALPAGASAGGSARR